MFDWVLNTPLDTIDTINTRGVFRTQSNIYDEAILQK